MRFARVSGLGVEVYGLTAVDHEGISKLTTESRSHGPLLKKEIHWGFPGYLAQPGRGTYS